MFAKGCTELLNIHEKVRLTWSTWKVNTEYYFLRNVKQLLNLHLSGIILLFSFEQHLTSGNRLLSILKAMPILWHRSGTIFRLTGSICDLLSRLEKQAVNSRVEQSPAINPLKGRSGL